MKKFFSGLLTVVGVVLMWGSGICSLGYAMNWLITLNFRGRLFQDILGSALFVCMLVGLFGGIPFLLGYGLRRMGNKLKQSVSEKSVQTEENEEKSSLVAERKVADAGENHDSV